MHVRGFRVPANPNRAPIVPSSRIRQSDTYRYHPAIISLTMRRPGSTGGRNTSMMEVFSMGRPPGWAAALTGRAVMRSPGRPPVRRDLERAFGGKIAEGLTSEDAAMACGVSGPVKSRWFRHAGGMPPIELSPVSRRYLCFSEREQIAVMRAEGASMRAIADRLGRSPSTISRELRRNAATRNGKLEYRASTAQWKLT